MSGSVKTKDFTTYECVDSAKEFLDNSKFTGDDNRIAYVTASCFENALCPPYEQNKPILCVVCAR